MSLPKEPRQQMINMMYLVLTAMLALNITKEVLTAFQTINTSIEGSNASIDAKNEDIYTAFEKAEAKPSDRDRVKPYNDKAKEIKAETDKLMAYLGSWKDSVISRSGGYVDNDGVKELKSVDDIDASTKLFVEEKKGDDVKKRLQDYVNFIAQRFDNPAEKESIRKQIPIQLVDPKATEDNPQGSWSFATFHNIPVVAAIAMFSKFQNDVKNAEAVALEALFKHIGDDVVVFDDLAAIAVPKTSYALEGQDMEANVMLVAYNKSYNPSMTSSAGPVKVENGIGTLKFKASGAGLKTVNGVITREVKGENKSYPYKFEYMVGNAGASLQLDKMMVMYIGVDNPVTLSASGYNIEDVKPGMPWATVKAGPSKGTYLVNVDKPGTFDYSIDAVSRGGNTGGKIGAGKIRVKNIPAPNATVGGRQGGTIPTASAKAQQGVVAKLEDFVFETQFKVTSFRFTLWPRIGDPLQVNVAGNLFTGRECQELVQRSKPGDRWLIENVQAVGPDKKTRTINSIVLTLN